MARRVKRLQSYTAFDYFNVLVFLFLAIIMVYPFWSVLVTSLVNEGEFYRRPLILWPNEITMNWYKFIFSSDKLIRSFFVTVFVTVAGTLYSLTLTTTLAFGLSKKDLPGRGFFINLIIVTMFFGGGLIPYYLLIRNMGLINNILVLIIPTGINVWYFSLIKAFFNQIPAALEESARIDGANDIVIFLKIVLPTSIPVLATFALFFGVRYWNAWYDALLFITNEKLFPLQLILRRLVVQNERPASLTQAYAGATGSMNVYVFEEGIKMATVIVATLPILIVYPFLQKYFVKGIMLGSVKG